MKGKTIILTTLLVILLFAVFLFLHQNEKKENEKIAYSEAIKIMPDFLFYTLDGEKFDNANLPKNSNTLLILFNPDCDICHVKTSSLEKLKDKLTNTSLLFISNSSIDEINEFVKLDLINGANIFFLQDKDDSFYNLFKPKNIPFMILYDKKNIYINEYQGKEDLSTLIRDITK